MLSNFRSTSSIEANFPKWVMGNSCASYPGDNSNNYQKLNDLKWVYTISNDYELAIRLSKELEYYLEKHFNATGRGLHEKITTAQRNFNQQHKDIQFPQHLVKNMRRLATIRNRLIHDRSYHAIDDKNGFIQTFKSSHQQLQQLIIKMNAKNTNNDKSQEQCIIL